MSASPNSEKLNWQKLVAPYSQPDAWRSVWQVVNTLVPYFALWAAMFWSLNISYWLTLLLSIPAAGFMVRAFIIFHDCCHGSFFKSRNANEILGVILGIITLTPFYYWRHDHAIHHATAGNLDKRGVGDVPTLTVQEYLAAPWWKRTGYRILRNPLFLFTVGSTFVFLISHRLWIPGTGRREKINVLYTNFVQLAIVITLGQWLGYAAFFKVFLPIAVLASSAGVWLFYVQHQFETVYWAPKEQWSFFKAGLQGSSFYKLPAILQWFSGNIGFHHIHHLSPKIPNYFLQKCYKANPELQIRPMTLFASLKSTSLHLYDETAGKLVGYGILKQYRSQSGN
jgi:omega-6 fatty acid desaturase (delta-12 desaturase)